MATSEYQLIAQQAMALPAGEQLEHCGYGNVLFCSISLFGVAREAKLFGNVLNKHGLPFDLQKQSFYQAVIQFREGLSDARTIEHIAEFGERGGADKNRHRIHKKTASTPCALGEFRLANPCNNTRTYADRSKAQ